MQRLRTLCKRMSEKDFKDFRPPLKRKRLQAGGGNRHPEMYRLRVLRNDLSGCGN